MSCLPCVSHAGDAPPYRRVLPEDMSSPAEDVLAFAKKRQEDGAFSEAGAAFARVLAQGLPDDSEHTAQAREGLNQMLKIHQVHSRGLTHLPVRRAINYRGICTCSGALVLGATCLATRGGMYASCTHSVPFHACCSPCPVS